MPHKITLTGSATGPLREYDRYVAFDMREKGSPSAPKGLKKSTFISYTVFVAKKAFNKTGLTKKSIMHEKILIQGEPTLDIPIDECPGEVGVICFQITVLPNKNDKEKNQSDAKKEPKQEASAPSQEQKNTEPTKQGEEQVPVSQPVAKEEKKEVKPIQPEVQQAPTEEKKAEEKKTTLSNQPKGTQDLLNFDDIIVPEEFLKTRPNPEKTQKVIDFVKRTGRLDEPLTIEKGSKILKDGYRRYVVAKTVKMDQVPVVYEYQK
ncbi:plasmid stabilization protein [Priestia megaterium]|uniref:plasmid stabilization protein n=2 Tax=Priestia megaterium TaxID=1404 RepID=UPI000BF5E3C8|nr:plasmid stabilization protein [Priestia megaterium]KAA8755768.1 plasmid stabilization protein [Priestia megaterium]PET66156.1 plasmid stabilization protein [Priestia megaterium]PEZ50966.1 plasmid stabilization protein [Priestia megaterium]PFK84126.1 plasmid stabilization protein [Priestia megaterium]PFL60294.1 plasmid stabilization protein [Priestia megaterium]